MSLFSTEPRFKIDVWEGVNPFGLFQRKKIQGLFWGSDDYWAFIGSFDTREDARAHYEQIKCLPEYLD